MSERDAALNALRELHQEMVRRREWLRREAFNGGSAQHLLPRAEECEHVGTLVGKALARLKERDK